MEVETRLSSITEIVSIIITTPGTGLPRYLITGPGEVMEMMLEPGGETAIQRPRDHQPQTEQETGQQHPTDKHRTGLQRPTGKHPTVNPLRHRRGRLHQIDPVLWAQGVDPWEEEVVQWEEVEEEGANGGAHTKHYSTDPSEALMSLTATYLPFLFSNRLI